MKTSDWTLWLVFLALPASALAEAPRFLAQRIDGPTPWYGPFSEGAAVFDVDGDGVLDITSGPYWYRGPEFVRRPLRDCPTASVEFVQNLGEFPYDLNGDGKLDLISASWFQDGIFWYENVGTNRLWPRHQIVSSRATEALIIEDINADGRADILPNHYSPQEIFWVEILPGPEFRKHVVGKAGSRHGIGLGDLNGDARPDIITMDGWYEAPEDRANGAWTWHPDWNNPGLGGIRMLAHDVNRDGLTDVIYGMGHAYGLYWLEQKQQGGTRSWERHLIRDDWSQAHTLVLFDIDQDGRLDLVTGKRIRGHGEGDPGSLDPIGVYWYDIDGGRFFQHVIAYNSLTGTGMNINLVDLDGDSDVDLVLAGKSGLYLLENMQHFSKSTGDILQRY